MQAFGNPASAQGAVAAGALDTSSAAISLRLAKALPIFNPDRMDDSAAGITVGSAA
jgi:hypothetical protein